MWPHCHQSLKWNFAFTTVFFSSFFPASFLHAVWWLGLECVSAKTLRVVLVGKGGRVLWGWGTQHKSGSTVSLCTGARVPSVKLFSDFSLSSIHSFPFRCLCSKIKPLWSLHQRFGVYNNTAMVVTLNLRQHHDMLFFCEVMLALNAMNRVNPSRCFPLLCLFSSAPADCFDW